MRNEALKRLVDPLKRKVQLGIQRFVLWACDDTKKIQRVQIAVYKDEVRDSVERFQNYGFTSHPKKEAEGVVLFLGGDRSHGIVIAIDDRRYRLVGLEEGEVAMFSDEGDYIKFKRGNVIEVHTPKAKFSGDVEIAGKLDVVGDITSQNDIIDKNGSMGEMRGVYNPHKHNENGIVTDPPDQQMT